MLRALSTRRSSRGYERLAVVDESTALLEGKLKRAASVPAGVFNPSRKSYSSRKLTPEFEFTLPEHPQAQAKKSAKKLDKIHPIFSLLNSRSKKKPTAKPEFARYLEYLKEGGMAAVIQ
ncbi:Sodium/potassium-transporting ATPase subunit alpha-1 like [Melia azedarach]|uniref:Sodium/potassium-transporting ATPase subunit alpha-1 like n=1 Tax=Melia azedarach TaxID=155640 RepID=A0ACC1XSE9_MELAZ|nr:Sodium/potassium-transporting ATPase subunit alpha-1 like [Melia azedarach]